MTRETARWALSTTVSPLCIRRYCETYVNSQYTGNPGSSPSQYILDQGPTLRFGYTKNILERHGTNKNEPAPKYTYKNRQQQLWHNDIIIYRRLHRPSRLPAMIARLPKAANLVDLACPDVNNLN